MTSFTELSTRQMLGLAHKSQLSLLLRHRWLRKIGMDPVESLRHNMRFINGMFSGIALLFGALLCVLAGMSPRFPETYKDIAAGAVVLLGLVGISMFIGFGIYYTQIPSGDDKRRPGLNFRYAVCKIFAWLVDNTAYGYVTHKALMRQAKETAKLDLQQWQELGVGIVVDVAERILEHNESPDRTKDVHIAWSKRSAQLQEEFEKKYGVLAQFGLVHGPYDHFFNLARKRIEEKKKVAEANQAKTAQLPPQTAEALG